MAENRLSNAARIWLAVTLVGGGAALAAATSTPIPVHETVYMWMVGWALAGAGGWFVPHRVTAGIFIGVALAEQVPAIIQLSRLP